MHFLFTRRIIQEILNRQTIHQFSSYAKQQYPDAVELQQALIRQLQEQHFQQYMQQMMEQSSELLDGTLSQSLLNSSSAINSSEVNHQNNNSETAIVVDGSPVKSRQSSVNQIELAENPNTSASNNNNNGHFEEEVGEEDEDEDSDEEEGDSNSTGPGIPGRAISNASMWTRKDIATFKETIRAEGGDGILKVGHGEIATIRVPTHENGNCIFWEFATDSYDIGFGLLFEWNASPDNQVSIHISESEDEEDEEGKSLTLISFVQDFNFKILSEVEGSPNDVEKGGPGDEEANLEMKSNGPNSLVGSKLGQNPNEPPVSVIIPIYRRDAHEEVFAGSHSYPGRGVYLLKFDNSYSLWRSKTLYYRVYYTKET